jgi:hypothetical protein
MILGDVNGDGIVDQTDLDLLNSYLGFNFNIGLPLNTSITTSGFLTTYTNGYTTYQNPFDSTTGITFQIVNPVNHAVIASGSDGVLIPSSTDPRSAEFSTTSVYLPDITNITDYKLVITTSSHVNNYGGFDITLIDTTNLFINIRKIILNAQTYLEMLRADIDGDFIISSNDQYLLQSFISRVQSPTITSQSNAPTTNPFNKIGKLFNAINFTLEQFIDRIDDYSTNPSSRNTNTHVLPDIFISDSYYAGHNFYTTPPSIRIQKQLSWKESLVICNSKPKLVSSVFTDTGPTKITVGPQVHQYNDPPSFDPGITNLLIPNNIVIGNGGIKNVDGSEYKIDFELNTIILEIPTGLYGTEQALNIMDDFVSNYNTDTGTTRLNYPAMKYADGSFVTSDAILNDQIRFSVSIQSFSPNTNGLSTDGYTGAIVDGKMGVYVDYTTGLLKLNFTNLYEDPVFQTLKTRVQINIYLKKGGFNNKIIFVDSIKMQNILQISSAFTGTNGSGNVAIINLATDVTGILPIVHGGTGLSTVGASGTVLVSNGSSLSYGFIGIAGGGTGLSTVGANGTILASNGSVLNYIHVNTLPDVIGYSNGVSSANQIPKLDGYGYLDTSFYYKNPLYINAVSGAYTNTTTIPLTIGAFTFRFDKFIQQSLSSITLEVIVDSAGGAVSNIKLYNVNNNAYITLSGGSTNLGTSNTNLTYLSSDNLLTRMYTGTTDYIYEVQLALDTSGTGKIASCNMARLVLTYTNPTPSAPTTAFNYNFSPTLH